MNPGGIRADLVENANGDVTYGAAFAVQPFNNILVSMNLTGAQIKTILNQQWNGNNEAATGRKILQVSGLTYTWDVSDRASPSANAIVGDVLIDADGNSATPMVPMLDGTTYRIAASTFLSDGGDNFPGFIPGGSKLVGGLDIDALKQLPAGATTRRRRRRRTGSARSRRLTRTTYEGHPLSAGGPRTASGTVSRRRFQVRAGRRSPP